MKKLLAFLLPLLFAGCITGGAEKKWQAVCDDINAEWPLYVGDVELTRVSYADKSYTIHIVSPEADGLEYESDAYYADEDLYRQYGSYEAPYNVFVRNLRDASPALNNAISSLSEILWGETGGESTQGYLPLYIEVKAHKNATSSLRLQYNDCWL
jgi:hypothetical protein